jgi:hypothetical protein
VKIPIVESLDCMSYIIIERTPALRKFLQIATVSDIKHTDLESLGYSKLDDGAGFRLTSKRLRAGLSPTPASPRSSEPGKGIEGPRRLDARGCFPTEGPAGILPGCFGCPHPSQSWCGPVVRTAEDYDSDDP